MGTRRKAHQHTSQAGILAMKNACLALLLLSSLTDAIYAKEQPPKLLVNAAQCLATKQYLPSSKAMTLIFGYLVDAKSYPGQNVLYVVNYLDPGRSKGLVFAIFLTQQGRLQIFNIQNNATFVTSEHGIDYVDF